MLRTAQQPIRAGSRRAMSTVVSPAWVNERLSDVRVLDCSWFLPTMNRSGLEEFQTRRIPGAGYFDIDSVCDPSSSLPHMLPSMDDFAESATRLGVTNSTQLVCYDGIGMFTSPRAWWMFKHFGLTDVRVLGGGFPEWERAGFSVDSGAPPTAPVAAGEPFQCSTGGTSSVWSHSDIVANKEGIRILDARSQARFEGTAAEPRPGLPSGCIPCSHSVPFTSLLTEGMSTLKPHTELKSVLDQHVSPVDGEKPSSEITVSCGSGVTACVIALAVHEAYDGNVKVNLFDGSWTEYGTKTVEPKLRALLDALEEVGDPDIQYSMSNLTAKAPLLAPGLESLLLAVDARLEHIRSWPGQQAKTLDSIKTLAKDLQDNHTA